MNGNMKLLAVLVSLVLIVLAVGTPRGSRGAAPTETTMQKIIDRGTLRVGLATIAPGAYKDPKTQEWTGFHVQAAKELARQMGVKIEFVEVTWDTFIPALKQDRFDIYMPGTFLTVKRALEVQYSEPVYWKGYDLVVRANRNDIRSINDMNKKDRVLTGTLGGAEEEVAKIYLPNATTKFVRMENSLLAAVEVQSGRADGWLITSDLTRSFLKTNSWAKVVTLKPIWSRPLAYVIRQGDPDFKFFVDAFVHTLVDSGQMTLWADQYNEAFFQATYGRK